MSLQLPEKLSFDEIDFNELTSKLYKIFSDDFITSETKFLGKKVVFDNRVLDGDNYPEGFWHMITRKDYQAQGQRLPDFKRSKRLPWTKPIIEQYKEPEIKAWHNPEPSKDGSKFTEVYYLWYEAGSYLVILKERRNGYFLATSFYVNGYNVQKFEKKYQAGTKDLK